MAKNKKLTDVQLLKLLKQSPQEGMEALLERYTGLVWAVAGRYLKDPEDIRECVNDAFLEFYRGRDKFDPDKGTLETYLAAITRNLAVNRYRKNAAHGPMELLEDAAGPEDTISAMENRLDLEGALEQLPAEDAEIIRRKYYGGMTVQEIAAAMDLPYETVKKRHQRSLKRLRALLTAGLILLLAALLAACAWLVLRHFGIVPGVAVTTGAEIPAYTLAEPVVLETEDGTYTVPAAVYVEGALYVEVRLEFHEEAAQRLEKAIAEHGTYNGQDLYRMTVTCGGETVEPPSGSFDVVDGVHRTNAVVYAPPPEDGTVLISYLGVELNVPMERREAGRPEDYPYALGEEGGLLAIPRRQEDRVIVELYALNTGELPMAQMLVLDAYMQGDSKVITLTGEDGEVLHSNYWYDPAYFVTGTMSQWDFGEVEPGEYTLRVPYVYLVAELPQELEGIQIDLEQCTWEDGTIPLPYGALSLVSCEAAEGDAAPEESEFDSGWIFTLRWEPPKGGHLKFSTDTFLLHLEATHAPLPQGFSELGRDALLLDPIGEDGTFRIFCGLNPKLDWDLSQAALAISTKRLSYRWDHVFEIPVTIE